MYGEFVSMRFLSLVCYFYIVGKKAAVASYTRRARVQKLTTN